MSHRLSPSHAGRCLPRVARVTLVRGPLTLRLATSSGPPAGRTLATDGATCVACQLLALCVGLRGPLRAKSSPTALRATTAVATWAVPTLTRPTACALLQGRAKCTATTSEPARPEETLPRRPTAPVACVLPAVPQYAPRFTVPLAPALGVSFRKAPD